MKNLGKEFEQKIEWANEVYFLKREAIIQKIATPWKVQRRFNSRTKKSEIVSAFPEEKSTVDFGGTAKGKSIWFDAKSTQNKTSFPLANVKAHQVDFLKRVAEQGGIAFILIHSEYENKTWMLFQEFLDRFKIGFKRKSIPFSWLDENCPLIYPSADNCLDYLETALKG